jgi:cytochrome o ubiquinol oxidase subunit II
MKSIIRYCTFAAISLAILILFIILIRNGNMQLLNPQGYIAYEQSRILWGALIIGFLIAFFIIGAVFSVAFRFREENTRATYDPNWSISKRMHIVWWAVPLVAIVIISGLVWGTAHALDQYRPIQSAAKPIQVQVVALQWKWLFIYPQQQIASVNLLEFPANTPLDLQLTSDAPMNSFWIPELGGQIYEMPGMITQLHLLADKTGDFPGSPAQISGSGFATMRFTARSTSLESFNGWVQATKQSQHKLDISTYNTLAQPSSNYPPTGYALTDSNLFDEVLMKYMAPSQSAKTGGM